jgi:hypothetical protein
VAAVLPDEAHTTDDIVLYVNGRRETSTTGRAHAVDTGQAAGLRIGVDNGADPFAGCIDDVAVFDVALTDEQIRRLYTQSALSYARPCGGVWFDRTLGRIGDIDRDCCTTLSDVVFLSEGWLQSGLLAGDVAGGPPVDIQDVLAVSQDWLIPVGLVGHWPLDQTSGLVAQDRSIHGHHAEMVNMDEDAWVVGRIGQALRLDGVDEFLEAEGAIAGSAPRTCCAWIRTTQGGGDIFAWGDPAEPGRFWNLRLNWAGALRVQVGVGAVYGATPLHTGEWVHVAAVLPAGRSNVEDVLLYVNGSAMPDDELTIQPHEIDTAPDGPVRIGTDGVSYFQGELDDVRLYNRALSPAEIARLANP